MIPAERAVTGRRALSRRQVLAGGAGISAALAAESALAPAAFGAEPRAAGKRPPPLSPDQGRGRAEGPVVELAALASCSEAVHVARRVTYGADAATVAEVSRLGAAGFIESQLAPGRIDDSLCDSYLASYPLAGLSARELASRVPFGSGEQMSELSTAAVVRATWSRRQLYEMMVEFWWNHFNVGLPSAEVWNLAGEHDNLIRRHCLGRFADLLRAMAHSPALLVSLNQEQSVRGNPNENYGRELLELHTVGLGAGYSEHDVHQSALLLTGLGTTPDGCSACYTPSRHYTGAVRVMGFADPNSSVAGGRSLIARYLEYLAHHEATARHIASKLAVRFVSDNPSAGLVEHLAQTYLRHDTAIAPVLRTLFSSTEFLGSAGRKLRRPLEAVAASLRALDYRPSGPKMGAIADLQFMLQIMGQQPMGWMQPNGYPDTAESWVSASATQTAWAAHLRLALGWWKGELSFPGILPLIGHPSPRSPAGAVVDRLTERVAFASLAKGHKRAILRFMGLSEGDEIGASGLSGLGMVTKVILDSPYFAVR